MVCTATGPQTISATSDHDNRAETGDWIPKFPPPRRRAVLAWCLYDWANSSYPTVIVTFVFAAYFTTTLSADPEAGTGRWGGALAISGLVVAVLAPVLGALADQGGRRKPWIGGFTVIAVVCAAALWLVEPDPTFALLALVLVATGNAAFEFAQVFYNSMLPDLAPRGRVGRLSGWAWGLGYAGGLACLGLALVLFVKADGALVVLDTEAAEHVRITGPFVGLWLAVFAVPLFLFTPDRPARRQPLMDTVRAGLASLWATVRALPRQGQIGRFLLARMIYTDGLNTLFAFGGNGPVIAMEIARELELPRLLVPPSPGVFSWKASTQSSTTSTLP